MAIPERRRSRQWERMEQLGYVTIKQAAELARISVGAMYNWRDDHTVETIQIGKKWYVTTQSLQKRLGPLANIKPGSKR